MVGRVNRGHHVFSNAQPKCEKGSTYLRLCKATCVDTCGDAVRHVVIQLVDLVLKVRWEQVWACGFWTQLIKGGIEHLHDLPAVIVHHSLLLLVLQAAQSSGQNHLICVGFSPAYCNHKCMGWCFGTMPLTAERHPPQVCMDRQIGWRGDTGRGDLTQSIGTDTVPVNSGLPFW